MSLLSTAASSRSFRGPFVRALRIALSSSSSSSPLPTLTLYTKRDCTLCEDAKWEIREAGLINGEHFQLREVDIEAQGNEELRRRHRYSIPVFEVGREVVGKGGIDLDKLREALNKAKEE